MKPLVGTLILSGTVGILWVLTSRTPDTSIGTTAKLIPRLFEVLFVTGFTWSWVLWPSTGLDPLERTVVSVFLSLALFSLGVFSAAKLSRTVTERTFVVTTLSVQLLGLGLLGGMQALKRRARPFERHSR